MESNSYFAISVFAYRLVNTIEEMYKSVIDFYATNAKIKSTIKELEMLTDRELNDIGIVRADIPFIARESV